MKKIVCAVFILFLLSSCSKEPTVAQQFTDFLIAVNEKENKGNNFGRKLNEKEHKEQELFIQLMEFTNQQDPEVNERVVALKKSVRERSMLLEKEESAVRESKETIGQLAESMNEMGFTSQVEDVVNALNERSGIHEAFILQYKKLLDSQMQLYTQLEDQSVREFALQKHVSEVNDLIAASQQTLVEFNETTREVNRLAGRALKSLEQQK
ncbi:YkyA family protein [Sporosarcina ureae]|uniref:YkyA family protein n=1 Tax=Sporosarcina ureae TaxID=1571 RepID=UPI0026EB781D|nr:YkyA family protein [Sporosarcina ureae]